MLDPFISDLSIKPNSCNCFLPLLDALNSTGKVTNWNKSPIHKSKIPILTKFNNSEANPIIIKIEDIRDVKFTIGTNAVLNLRKE